MTDDLPPKPAASTEPPELFPGGVDSVADQERYGEIPDGPTGPDPDPSANPETGKSLPAAITEPEDTGADDDREVGPIEESPA